MKTIETDPRLPAWLNRALNAWPLCLDEESVRTVYAVASDVQGVYRPGDESLFMNGVWFVRLTLPFGIWLHLKPTINLRFQCGIGWKGNGRFALTFRFQSDEEAARGVLGPNHGQARGWERGTA